MARKLKALVTGAGALLGQGIIRALRAGSLGVEIIAADPSPYSAGLYLADRGRLLPLAADPGYLDAVRALIRTERPDIVFIGTDVELPVLSGARENLEHEFGTVVLVSSPRVVGIANDKWLTNQFLREAGFDYPRSSLPDGAWELARQIGYPLVVKPRVGARSRGVRLVNDESELRDALATPDGLVIQECVGDPTCEYTAGVVAFEGQPSASIVMRRDLRDGNTYRAYAGDFPEFNHAVQLMAGALRPFGPVNFQFRADGNRVKVFEINGRFSGTTPLRALAGFNEVELCIRHLLLQEDLRQPTVSPVTFLRYWTEIAIRSDQFIHDTTAVT
jgi:carbamoyl-phosphate synthase large subunit